MSFAEKLSRLPLSAFDNCSANDGRAYVTTDITMALNMTSKAARYSPCFFSCVSRYIHLIGNSKDVLDMCDIVFEL